ncbi:MAG: protein kinase [Polyangiaceae bacterium]|jgi:tRNA A-37 threonylcarbamoyl transferase component Bud32
MQETDLMTDARPLTPVRARYQVLMEVGRGGMGIVHLAMTRGPQGFVKLVVLKRLHPELVGSEAATRMFLEEARISARLAHPNVVQVYEVIEHEGAPTMVMEYLEGRPLSTVLDEDPSRFSAAMHLHVHGCVLEGLHAAHELRDYDGTPLNLIHRDISPHNVFLLFDGRVKVLDFGIAKAARSEVETRTGELKGKIRYMAPEQLRGEASIDRRADVFAVGVMLWEALAAQRMWSTLTDADVMLRLLNHQIPPLPRAALVPRGLAQVCTKALSPLPQDRYATAADFQRDLEKHAAELAPVARSDDLRALLCERFGDARAATNRLIDAHIKVAEQVPLRPGGDQGPRTDGGAVHQRTRSFRRTQSHAAARGVGIAALVAALGASLYAVRTRQTQDRNTRAGQSGNVPDAPHALSPLGCPTGFKACGEACVSIDLPGVGCANEDCAPCVVGNATARCNAHHACDIAVCYEDYDDCDGDPANGCEAQVRTDPNHCGSCGRACSTLPHAQAGCGDGCTIWRCDPGFRDCNGVVADGCEVRVSSDVKNCGHCGTTCARGLRCRAGRCV